jgi:hypothetical protein
MSETVDPFRELTREVDACLAANDAERAEWAFRLMKQQLYRLACRFDFRMPASARARRKKRRS